jgi:AraC-like DNA-binding protein
MLFAHRAFVKHTREVDLPAQTGYEITRLYAVVRHQSYSVVLIKHDGEVVYQHGNERGPLRVHFGPQDRTKHSDCSCAAAPIFDPFGNFIAVLGVARPNCKGDREPIPLVAEATEFSARAIEECLFRERFGHAWTLAAAPSGEHRSALLLALDGDQRILGADRVARKVLALTDERLRQCVHLSSAFEFDASLFRWNNGRDAPFALSRVAGDGASWNALLTSPLGKSRMVDSWARASGHSRPRISLLDHLPVAERPTHHQRGLPSRVTRLIRQYIESHLDQKIDLNTLATMAGLSTHHFARAFHESVGAPPHGYLLSRRLDHAEQMLRETQLSLSEIALTTGFADQSHLARHFRRRTGMCPSVFRRGEH